MRNQCWHRWVVIAQTMQVVRKQCKYCKRTMSVYYPSGLPQFILRWLADERQS